MACDCGLTYFRLKTMSTSSSVRLLLAFIFLNVCTASFWRRERNWLIFIASDTSGCILSIIWKRSSNDWSFSFLPWQTSVFVDVALINADNIWGHCWDAIPAIASASLLIGLPDSEFCPCGVCLTIDNVLLGGKCVALFCSRMNCCGNGSFRFGRLVRN